MAEVDDDQLRRDAAQARRRFSNALREARGAHNLSQTAVAKMLGRHPSAISKAEKGTYDVATDLVHELAATLGAPQLIELATTPTRDGQPIKPSVEREEVLRTLLKSRVLDRLVIVVADEIPIVDLLEEARVNLPPSIDIIFPTRRRQEQLDGPARGSVGPGWDVQKQINRVFEATAEDQASGGLGSDVTLYESDRVHLSFVLIGSSDGPMCVTWPILPNGTAKNDMVPASVSSDPTFIQSIEDHLRALRHRQLPLTHLKAVVLPNDDPTSEHRHVLTTFFELGNDTEAGMLAEMRGENGSGGDAGFAVALVLVHGIVGTVDRSIGRRLLLPYDDKYERHELFATHISNADFEPELTPRSTSDAETAVDRVLELGYGDVGAVTKVVFQRAAARSIRDEFGIEVDLDEFEEIEDLPEPLRVVGKGDDRLPVLPRLFHLDLSPPHPARAASPTSRSGDDAVDPARAGVDFRPALKKAFQLSPKLAAVGLSELRSPDTQFNKFIEVARAYDGGWLLRTAEKLKVAE